MRFVYITINQKTCQHYYGLIEKIFYKKRNIPIIVTSRTSNSIFHVDSQVIANPAIILRRHIHPIYPLQQDFCKEKNIDIKRTISSKYESNLHSLKSIFNGFNYLIYLFSKKSIHIILYAENSTILYVFKQTHVIYHRLYYEQVYRLHLFKKFPFCFMLI